MHFPLYIYTYKLSPRSPLQATHPIHVFIYTYIHLHLHQSLYRYAFPSIYIHIYPLQATHPTLLDMTRDLTLTAKKAEQCVYIHINLYIYEYVPLYINIFPSLYININHPFPGYAPYALGHDSRPDACSQESGAARQAPIYTHLNSEFDPPSRRRTLFIYSYIHPSQSLSL